MKQSAAEKKRRTVIITGGNTGLGYQCAKAIIGGAAADWRSNA